ncbi:MAG TPA: GreA/GreB family elongation factor [Candidatus Omnitrophota bacterium]|jgi:regulator of nucleoside diphosphate kinase|nr:MAG: Regulator of nucleoside diphosphate kinase [Candidatus Omnitrophica bacterium ADurb.Bin314]HOE68410.1 GreA/GreB family elongation factor [Candidatus Omnitrophota bacterium]HQB94262.1 GreA/GreB family elongation factor [Candidatus Omnitrophota bacterium]
MVPEKLHLPKSDFERLNEAITVAREMGDGRDIILGKLKKKLKSAEVVLSDKMPKNTVTMNSAGKLLWLDTKEVRLFWLGFPSAVDHDGNKVSVFSSLGIALLGARVGEATAQEVPTGHRMFKVLKLLYQPEAMRDYHL